VAPPVTAEHEIPKDVERSGPGQVRRSETAEIVCAQRAAETLRPADRRLIDDPYARYFLTKGAYRLLCSARATAKLTRAVFDRRYPGYMAIVLLRNRWYEDLLARAVADGIEQVVLLGAGYDSTSMRLDLGGATLFEVDAPPTQAAKREVIERNGLTVCGDVRYVSCDFERDSLPDRLREHGFDPGIPSLIAWWGVSFFLTEEGVRQTAADVASLATAGSRFVFDYLDASVVEGTTTLRGAARARAAVAKRGESYKFGLTRDGAAAFVRSYGFAVEQNLSITDLARMFGGRRGFPYSIDDFFGVITGKRELP
jgi:methyltransferase (TIGR00027 family)